MSSDNLSFKFRQSFIHKMKDLPDIFTNNELGRVVYERTYSRLKNDGTSEVWWETIKRVIEGCYSLQKDHILKNGQVWNDNQAHKSAEEMYDLMYNMKFLPPGRGLWCMGSDIIHKKKLGLSLFNCSFISTEKILNNPSRPFCVGMDMLMLGVGLGVDTKGANMVRVWEPIITPNQLGMTYVIINDDREGWVSSLEMLLSSYFVEGSPSVVFDYSEIREKGTKLKTFGGFASGPGPLIEMHTEIDKVLKRESSNSFLTSTGIADIFNLIGACVVSGNIRRSAELVLGEEGDRDFLDLKNYDINPHRMSYGWASNNSVLSSVGSDYTDIQNRICNNGEPGIIWLENMRKYSRMCDSPDWEDRRVLGTNPCLSIDTIITTSLGLRSIKELIGVPFTAIVDGKEYPSSKDGFFRTGKNKQLFKLELDNGINIRATDNHEFVTPSGMIKLSDLKVSDRVSLSNNNGYKWNTVEDITKLREMLRMPTIDGLLSANRILLLKFGVSERFDVGIKSIEKDNVEDVYCCNIPNLHRFTANGIKVKNCGEISLDSYEVCNLNECFPARHSSLKEFKRTLKYSFMFTKAVTLAPIHIPETQDIVKINRRIGNSMSGIVQFISKFGIEELRIWCKQAYLEIQRWDAIYSRWLRIPKSIKTTTVKPSGTVSLLAHATPGVHYPHSRYYIRRVRMSADSVQLEKLKSKGYYIESCTIKPEHTSIVEFPIDVGECKTLDNVTMWEQLELAAFMQYYYSDNQVSCTVTFREDEGRHIAAALDTYQYRLKGISFLPRSDGIYPQMPYEKISVEQYNKMCDNINIRKSSNNNGGGGQKRKRDEMPDAINFCDSDTCALTL